VVSINDCPLLSNELRPCNCNSQQQQQERLPEARHLRVRHPAQPRNSPLPHRRRPKRQHLQSPQQQQSHQRPRRSPKPTTTDFELRREALLNLDG